MKILHISSFDEKNNHRLFNISISNKITSGFIRNNHDVINFSYKDFNKKLLLKTNAHVNSKLLNIADNYRPDLILLGHNNILNRKTIEEIRTKYNTKQMTVDDMKTLYKHSISGELF